MAPKNRVKENLEEQLSYEENVCKPYACAIQECLRRRDYMESKCMKEIDRWKQCLKEVKLKVAEQSASSAEMS